jgi:DNA-binding GntR family transcriptional regulator
MVIAKSLRREADYLREAATAVRFSVGRTALRQALGRLAGRGLVVHVPRCGWRVRPFDEADLDAYLEVREVMELKALELARHRLVADDLKRMLAANAPNGRTTRLDNRLHRYLVEKAENGYIRDFFDRHAAYYTTLFDFAAPETHVVAAMARQHRFILCALIDRDWSRARKALARHIRDQRPVVKELMRQLGQTRVQAQ